MNQWHPLFTQLLRPKVERYYKIETDMSVGDLPRQADLVLLRLFSVEPLPFTGIWKHLTPWNVLEYKGPTVSARLNDLDLLIELGLGIDRRLRARPKDGSSPRVKPEDVSYWYLANHLGKRFLKGCVEKLGAVAPFGPGLWQTTILQRRLILVSVADLDVDDESLPLHVLGQESEEKEREIVRYVLQEPARWGGLWPDAR